MTRSTPRTFGFRMPAEWELHDATWLTWPTDPDTFPPEIIARVEQTYVAMIQALRDGEEVHVLVDDVAAEKRVVNLAGCHPNLFCHQMKTQDAWIRDYGPTFVTNDSEVAMNLWKYNAYGEKYQELLFDARVPGEMQRLLQLRAFDSGVYMEGGSIEVNGTGTCLTTERCLLNKNRNEKLPRSDIEALLRDYLNVSKVIWLPGEGIAGDDTDGHIDNIARFVNETTIVCCVEENERDENFPGLKKNWDALRESGQSFTILPLPMPGKVENTRSGRLPASYANFYIGNKVVLLPTYDHPNDQRAAAILKEYFPHREVVSVDALPLVWGFGSIHCLTQQQPASRRKP